MEGQWLQLVPVAAAVGSFGTVDALGGSGFIAACVGGAVYGAMVRDHTVPDDAAFSEELGGLLNGLTMIVFGAAVLSAVWFGLRAVVVVVAVCSFSWGG